MKQRTHGHDADQGRRQVVRGDRLRHCRGRRPRLRNHHLAARPAELRPRPADEPRLHPQGTQLLARPGTPGCSRPPDLCQHRRDPPRRLRRRGHGGALLRQPRRRRPDRRPAPGGRTPQVHRQLAGDHLPRRRDPRLIHLGRTARPRRRTARRRARLRRPHRQAALDLPHGAPGGGARHGHLGRGVLADHRRGQRLGPDERGRGTRPRLPADQHADERLVRRPPPRRQPVRREPRSGRLRDGRAPLALPGHSPRSLGLRLRRAGRAGRHRRRRPHGRGGDAAEQAGLPLRLRSGDRRTGLADRGAAGPPNGHPRRADLGHPAHPHEAAAVRPPGHAARRRDRLHARDPRRGGTHPDFAPVRADLHAAQRARNRRHARLRGRRELARRRLRPGHGQALRAVLHGADPDHAAAARPEPLVVRLRGPGVRVSRPVRPANLQAAVLAGHRLRHEPRRHRLANPARRGAAATPEARRPRPAAPRLRRSRTRPGHEDAAHRQLRPLTLLPLPGGEGGARVERAARGSDRRPRLDQSAIGGPRGLALHRSRCPRLRQGEPASWSPKSNCRPTPTAAPSPTCTAACSTSSSPSAAAASRSN